jgi:monofunctional biosynthetic peptidoglycan transglycosylase
MAKKTTRGRGKAAAAKRKRDGGRALRARRLRRWAWGGVLALLLAPVALVGAFAVIDPPRGHYMRAEAARLGAIRQDWMPIGAISADLARAAVAAEDANFCLHWGFDMAAIRAAIEAGGTRGASTITQQTVKNVFLWHGRSWPRKALEALLTPLVEALWPKRRILEVYLNVAEFGPGIFGAEAAAQAHFGKPAAALSAAEAARLAAVLPAPASRDPRAGGVVARRAAAIMDGAATIARDGRAACFES